MEAKMQTGATGVAGNAFGVSNNNPQTFEEFYQTIKVREIFNLAFLSFNYLFCFFKYTFELSKKNEDNMDTFAT
jgi:hypothetical protein